MTRWFTFGKKEKLTQNLLIDRLFTDGSSFNINPFKVFYLEHKNPEDFYARILIAVPRRKFKHAVDRNRLKRLVRESYRLNKQPLLDHLHQKSLKIHVGFVFSGNSAEIEFAEVEKKMILCIRQLIGKTDAAMVKQT